MGIYNKITTEIKEAELAKVKMPKQALYYQGYIHGLKKSLKLIEENLSEDKQ